MNPFTGAQLATWTNGWWIAKTREEWCAECRIGMKRLRTALPVLESVGLIELRVFKYGVDAR